MADYGPWVCSLLFSGRFSGPNLQSHFHPGPPEAHLRPLPRAPPIRRLHPFLQGGSLTALLKKARNLPEQSLVYVPLGTGSLSMVGAGQGRGERARAFQWQDLALGFLCSWLIGSWPLWLVILRPTPHRPRNKHTAGMRLRAHPPARSLREELSSAIPRASGSHEDRAGGKDRGGS